MRNPYVELLSHGVGLVVLLALGASAKADEKDASRSLPERESVTERGKVVWLADAMARRHDVKIVPEARESVQVLETADGRLLPLVEDIRGRSFRRDERLRAMEVELLARRFEGAPFLQIIRIYEVKDGRRFEIDYWCEICAIALYELKPCDCCQGPIELRRREAASSD
jgi:hypothetical protein